jgi:uncharacterized protein YgbK (DUF1537 family)
MIPLILSDDFSGACDAAARAAIHGHSAAAVLPPPVEVPGASLLAFSTETRHWSPEAARQCIRSLAPFLCGRLLYKKIDSTIRGPWVAEVDEILCVTDLSQAVVCPAFPALGRTVRNGWLWVGDHPVQQIICPFTVRDALTEEDLARIAGEICGSILPVGSAGLAQFFFQRDSGPPSPLSSGRVDAPCRRLPPPEPWLVFVGSDHPASQAQLAFLENARLEGVLMNPRAYPETVAGIFAAGGETAARLLRSIGAHGITGLREVMPGIPVGRILGGRYNGTIMIIKAGAFGAPDAIVRAIQSFL